MYPSAQTLIFTLFVCQHGNRASSSKSGSADLMEAHGCHISNVTPAQVPHIIDTTNFCFLFSQTYHPAMKNVAATRKEIGVSTIFNILGPMSNPARPARTVTGVHSPGIGELMANALRLTGVKEAMVVCGAEKLDEVCGTRHVICSKVDDILNVFIFEIQ